MAFKKIKLIFLATAALLLVVVVVQNIAGSAKRLDDIGSADLVSMRGDKVKLSSLNTKERRLVSFWATWCKPCIAEMPMLDSVSLGLDKDKWDVIFISAEEMKKIESFKSKNKYSFQFFKLEQRINELGIYTLPKTLVINQEGVILFEKEGMITQHADDFLNHLKSLE